MMAGDRTALQLLSRNLKKLRGLVGLSQLKLAEKCNLSTNFISELEGEKAWVSAETLDRLASALGVQLHSLFAPDDLLPTDTELSLQRCLTILERHSEQALSEVRAELARVSGTGSTAMS